jgi:hypothetical protein
MHEEYLIINAGINLRRGSTRDNRIETNENNIVMVNNTLVNNNYTNKPRGSLLSSLN